MSEANRIVLAAAFVPMMATMLVVPFIRDKRLARRVYWSCWVVGITVFAVPFVSAGHVRGAIATSVAWAFLAVGLVYLKRPYSPDRDFESPR